MSLHRCCVFPIRAWRLLKEDCQAEHMTVEDAYGRDLESIRRSAEQGQMESPYLMGEIYSHKDLKMMDRKLAKQWYNLAAEQGHEDARASLEHLRWADQPETGGVNDNE